MNEVILVEPYSDDEDIDFSKLTILHDRCGKAVFTKHRNPVTSDYTLKCDNCGFELILINDSDAIIKIDKAAIDSSETELDCASFMADGVEQVFIKISE